mgnify:CR=1 FL=1
MPDPAHSERYDQALLWAAQLHRDQRRKGKPVPYISHLISVSALVWEDGGNEARAIAGLLHDAIEDAWLVIAADKAHNARDLMIDSRRDPSSWNRFRQGAEGMCWYLSQLHGELRQLLPTSRSVEMLGASVKDILSSDVVQRELPPGQSAEEWVAGYLARREALQA